MYPSINYIKNKITNENVIPVLKEYGEDFLTPVAAFCKLKRRSDKAFFLESVESQENIGRYSFLGYEPFETVRVRDSHIFIETKKESQNIKETKDNQKIFSDYPFVFLQKYFKKYKVLKSENLPSFCGGAIGYVAYDSIKYIEEISLPEKSNYLQPVDDIYLMLFKEIVVFDLFKKRILIVSNILLNNNNINLNIKNNNQLNNNRLVDNGFYNKNEKLKILDDAYKNAEKEIDNIASLLFSEEKRTHLSSINFALLDSSYNDCKPSLKPIITKKKFVNKVELIKDYIKEGDIFQCVISNQFNCEINVDPFYIYRMLRYINPAPYFFYISMGDNILLGASPEMFIKVEDGIVESHPIAGSRPRGKNFKEDKKYEKELLSSVKEKAEHLMLVDLARNDIGRIAKAASVQVEKFMKIEKFSHIMHLVSVVKGNLKKNISPWEVFCSCFPAGTLSGAPKIRAMEIISQLESIKRGPYGGAVVYYDFSGSLDSCITIRSLFIQKNMAYLQAGAGIVYDSNPLKEYEEVFHKSNAIRKAIELAHKI